MDPARYTAEFEHKALWDQEFERFLTVWHDGLTAEDRKRRVKAAGQTTAENIKQFGHKAEHWTSIDTSTEDWADNYLQANHTNRTMTRNTRKKPTALDFDD